ncbi:MAG: indolepyruvate/phenylpyruvate decarboxylase [Halopseudomonas sp.]
MLIGELLLQSLKSHGAKQVFGIPGDFALPFFKVMEESEILPLHTLSHEPGVGFAADAAARYDGGIGVAAVTYGAGALNMINSVACAYAERSPLVIVSGAPGRDECLNDLLLHHQVKTVDSQFNIYREITCAQTRLDDPATAPMEIARVLRECKEKSLPVLIELPRDQVFTDSGEPITLPPTPYSNEAVQNCASSILQRLQQASAPMLLVGAEIRRFQLEDKVAKLARQLNIPVATTFMGRGLLVDSDAPLVGTYIGMAGDSQVQERVEESDGLLMLGVIVSDTNFGISAKRVEEQHAMLASDQDVKVGFHFYHDIPLSALLDALLNLSKDLPAPSEPLHFPKPDTPSLTIDDQAITPMDIAGAVNDMMRQHGKMPIASDMGDCLFTAMDMEQTALTAPGYYATMGFGVPAGLGMQATDGRRPLILVGDGAFQMTGMELGNCSRYGWDPIVLVFNNASWKMLNIFQPESAFSDLGRWDFASMAAGMGGDGYQVDSRRQLHHALEKATNTRGRFQLIDIRIEPDQLSPTLNRFVTTINEKRRQATISVK